MHRDPHNTIPERQTDIAGHTGLLWQSGEHGVQVINRGGYAVRIQHQFAIEQRNFPIFSTIDVDLTGPLCSYRVDVTSALMRAEEVALPGTHRLRVRPTK